MDGDEGEQRSRWRKDQVVLANVSEVLVHFVLRRSFVVDCPLGRHTR